MWDKQIQKVFISSYKLTLCTLAGNDIISSIAGSLIRLQYIPRNMHTVFALLCFVVVIHWLIFPYPSGLLHWHCGNLTIAPVPAKQPWYMDKYFMWVHYERLHNHNKAKHNKTVCIFLGIYCTYARQTWLNDHNHSYIMDVVIRQYHNFTDG